MSGAFRFAIPPSIIACYALGMDWRSVNFDWNRARAFLVTAEEGSLSAAARALNMTQPTLGRQVTALEEELGVTLFERVGRGLVLTEPGLELLDHVRAMGEAAVSVSLTAGGQAQSIEGHVAITASEIYSYWLLPQIAERLRRVAPGIQLDIVASNAIRDLRRREADIAIRNVRPEEPDLIGKLIGNDSGTLFGTPEHIAKMKTQDDPFDLSGLSLIGFSETEQFLTQLAALGLKVKDAQIPVIADNHIVHVALTNLGLGLGAFPVGFGDAQPGLERALPGKAIFEYPVWLVAHRELHTNRRVRLVYDLVAEMLPGLIRGHPEKD